MGLPKSRQLARAGIRGEPFENGSRIIPFSESWFWVPSLLGRLEAFFLLVSLITELFSGTRSIVVSGNLTALRLESMLRRDMTFTIVRRRQERESTLKIATEVRIY